GPASTVKVAAVARISWRTFAPLGRPEDPRVPRPGERPSPGRSRYPPPRAPATGGQDARGDPSSAEARPPPRRVGAQRGRDRAGLPQAEPAAARLRRRLLAAPRPGDALREPEVQAVPPE